MKNNLRLCAILMILIIQSIAASNAQKLVDAVSAIVGNEVIYLSDVENGVVQQQMYSSRNSVDELRCSVFEELLISKLFLDQARLDSITVTDESVDSELNMRLNDFIRRAGSEQALEEYFKKSMIEIKKDLKKTLLNQEIINRVQSNIAEDVLVTPSDVKKFFMSIPKDSIPVIPSKIEISIIQADPSAKEENKLEARQKLLILRSRILGGENFSALAILYSEDTESAKKGGEIGYLTRGELEKEYADAAFSLNKNTVSKIIETKYGFHIIQLIDRKGDMVNTRHILLKPILKPEEAQMAIAKLDSISDLIRMDSLTFIKAAMIFSSHKDSKMNGGKLVKNDPNSRETWFTLEELDKESYVKVREMKIGEISEPFRTMDENGNIVFRVIRLDNELPAHAANLKEDYQTLHSATLQNKRSKMFQEWITKKIGITYIKISDEFKSCDFANKGWLK
jgi:peptidyl-prolyl cis-trans isomerase SurA